MAWLAIASIEPDRSRMTAISVALVVVGAGAGAPAPLMVGMELFYMNRN